MNKAKLTKAGIDYDEGVNRFGGKEEIYEKYLSKFFDSDLMILLREQLEDNDIDGAFNTAHNLKGTSGNLSFNSFFYKICKITDLLREGNREVNYIDMYDDLKSCYDNANNIIKEK